MNTIVKTVKREMSITEIRRAIKEAQTVEVWVKVTYDDGVMLQISKRQAKDLYRGFPGKETADAQLLEDGRLLIG